MSPSHPRRPDATHSSRRERTGRRPGTGALRARTLSVLLVAIGVAMITGESLVREAEARTGADLARMVGLVPARAVGSAVVFPLEGRFVGYAVTEGCTVAFLVAPFFVLAALLIASRRTRPLRGLRALAAVSLVFFTVNQARLLVVAASMRVWGFRTGYERSHVLLGTMLSTVGVLAGVLLFVWLVVEQGRRKDGRRLTRRASTTPRPSARILDRSASGE